MLQNGRVGEDESLNNKRFKKVSIELILSFFIYHPLIFCFQSGNHIKPQLLNPPLYIQTSSIIYFHYHITQPPNGTLMKDLCASPLIHLFITDDNIHER